MGQIEQRDGGRRREEAEDEVKILIGHHSESPGLLCKFSWLLHQPSDICVCIIINQL